MAGVMLAGKCCAIAPLFHEGHCITAVGGGGKNNHKKTPACEVKIKIFVQSGSQVFHNIEICYVVDSCPLRPHRKGYVSQLSAVLYVGFLQIGTPQQF